MKKYISLLLITLCLFPATGCRTHVLDETPVISAKQFAMEKKRCTELLDCFLKNDAKGFIGRLPEENQEVFTEAVFSQTRQKVVAEIGTPLSYRYLTTLDYPAMRPHIWVIRFEGKDPKGNLMCQEKLFRIITGCDEKGNILVLGFAFL